MEEFWICKNTSFFFLWIGKKAVFLLNFGLLGLTQKLSIERKLGNKAKSEIKFSSKK